MYKRQDEDRDDKINGPAVWKTLHRLRGAIFDFLPPELDFLEEFAIKHGDLTFWNLLVDDDGNITSMIDWEFVYASPTYDAMGLLVFFVWRAASDRRPHADFKHVHGRPARERRVPLVLPAVAHAA